MVDVEWLIVGLLCTINLITISEEKNCTAAIKNGFKRQRLVLYDAIDRNISKN